MVESRSPLPRLIAELKRRHVLRVAGVYVIVAAAIMAAAADFFPALRLPEWTVTFVAVLLVVGFPVALVLAWAFEITADGVRRTPETPPAAAVAVPARGRAAGFVGLGILIALGSFGAYSALRPSWVQDEPGLDSVAVLPFTSLSGDPQDEYFSDGLTEDVLGHLSRLGGVRVISRTSVMQYKRTTKPLREIGEELGVQTIVEGTVRRTGDKVRITATLIDARTDERLWSESYDRELTDILAVQADIGREVARRLDTRVAPEERRRLAAAGRTAIDPGAYEAYLRGIYHADDGQHAEAIRAFERATAADPGYAPAHAAMARSYYFLGLYGLLPPDQAFERMRTAAQAALGIDNGSAEAHAALALYAVHRELDWDAAERQFRRALELSPNNAQVHHDYAHFLLAVGRVEESAAQSRVAAELDPANSMLTACAGWHGFTAGQYDEAVTRSLKALMMMPDMFWPELILGWAYEQKGQLPEAVAAFRKAVMHSDNSSFATAALAHALARAGRRAEAAELLAGLEARAETEYVSAYDVATIHAGLGQPDQALEWLKRAWGERAGFVIHAGWDPRLAALHADGRFDALLAAMRVPKQRLAEAAPASASPTAAAPAAM